jgi:hypothetical protein
LKISLSFQKDRERAVYGLKEKNLAKAYIKLIPLGMGDPDAIRLLNWKKPTERHVRSYVAKIKRSNAHVFRRLQGIFQPSSMT